MSNYNKFKENAKFQHIVAAARNLFYRYGMKRVTIEEICREANVSKMTFYKFFANKLELATYLLNLIFDTAMQEYLEIINSEKTFPEKIKDIIELKRRGTENAGAEFIAELVRHPEPEIAAIYAEQSKKSLATTMNFLKQAQKNGDIRPDVKLEFIMYMMNKMLEMSMDESSAKLYETPQDQIMELTNFFFYGILKRK